MEIVGTERDELLGVTSGWGGAVDTKFQHTDRFPRQLDVLTAPLSGKNLYIYALNQCVRQRAGVPRHNPSRVPIVNAMVIFLTDTRYSTV
jgi:hypothetical protein